MISTIRVLAILSLLGAAGCVISALPEKHDVATGGNTGTVGSNPGGGAGGTREGGGRGGGWAETSGGTTREGGGRGGGWAASSGGTTRAGGVLSGASLTNPGGTTNLGGRTAAGGTVATAGATGAGYGGAGGSSSFSCTPGDTTVCFLEGAAKGAMTGWAWVSLGALDTLTDPTCDTDKREIHNRDTSGPCTTTTNWNTKDALCISGKIPPLPKEPFQSDYDYNWGIMIGVNTSEPPGKTLGKDYTTITLTFTGEPTTGNRAELHVKGDTAGTTYCADTNSGKEMKLTSFNKACFDGATADPAKGLTADMVRSIDKVGIQVSSTQEEIAVKNLCLLGIAFK